MVPVKDRHERMLRCLDSLLAIDYPAYDVLVLDNGSTDGTAQACRERGASARVPVGVRTMQGSLGRLRNAGARLAGGQVVAYTDSDCRPEPGWLAAGAHPFTDPAVGVVTGMTLPERPPPFGPWHSTIEITEQTWRFETCNAFFRRRALVSTEGFLEDVSMWEDTAAGWGLLAAGWEARFEPGAVVLHEVTDPPYRVHLRRVHRYGQEAAVIRRHPEARERLMWARYFHRRRDAAVVAAALGVALFPFSRAALLAAAPYAWQRRPHSLTLGEAARIAKIVGIDAAILSGMLRGSLRWRRLVL